MPFFREIRSNNKSDIGIGLDIIDSCNVRCKQCFYEKNKGVAKVLSFNQIKGIVKKTKDNFSELYILGGEPTLHSELGKILKIGIENFEKVILVTNGLKFSDSKFCQKMALPNVSMSMHRRAISASAEKTVNELYGRKGVFRKSQLAWENVVKCWRGDVCVQLNIPKPLVDSGYAEEIFKWSREMGYEPIIELTKPGIIFERGNKLDVTADEIGKMFHKFEIYDKNNYPKLTAEALVPPSYGHNCTMVETGIHVNIHGDVIPCIAHENFSLGNIFHDDIEEILNHPLRLAIQDYKNWIVGPCRECEYFNYCHGGCRGEALWDTGCPRASDPYCWHIPAGLTLKDMVPKTCEGCILEDHPGCKIKV